VDITFNCGWCGQQIAIDEAGAGASVQCPKCGKSLTVPSATTTQPRQAQAKRASLILVTCVALLVFAGVSSMFFVSTRRSKSIERENSQLRKTAATLAEENSQLREKVTELEKRVAAITEQTKSEQQLTYQGASVTEWIKLANDSDNETRERAWTALSVICVNADAEARTKVLTPLLSPLIKKPLADKFELDVRWYAAECNLFLNRDEETYLKIAEWIALEQYAKKDVRWDALAVFALAAPPTFVRTSGELSATHFGMQNRC
jgi:cell division protein FtsB